MTSNIINRQTKQSLTPIKLALILVLASLFFTSCRPANFIYTEDGKIECGADGKAIILTNNETARDPAFDELIAFILADTTDNRQYITGGPDAFVCADFAEMVHNNAEAAGIRAAWVSVNFEGIDEGHALNAFETTDKGLVFIDCTNGGATGDSGNSTRSRDAIAYIETSNKYGVLPIERVTAQEYDYYPFSYEFYTECEKTWQEYRTKLAAFNEEVDRFNSQTGSRVYIIGSAEAEKMWAWKESLLAAEKELEILRERTGNRWFESEYSSFLVKSVNIHW